MFPKLQADSLPTAHLGSPYSAIKRSKFEPVELRWKNLESLLQSKVSQKEKNILYEHTRMESRKVVPICRARIETQT